MGRVQNVLLTSTNTTGVRRTNTLGAVTLRKETYDVGGVLVFIQYGPVNLWRFVSQHHFLQLIPACTKFWYKSKSILRLHYQLASYLCLMFPIHRDSVLKLHAQLVLKDTELLSQIHSK